MKNEVKKMPSIEEKRHSLSHILAAAVLEMFPDAKLGTGPDTDNGFYYDFALPRTLIPEDLAILEEKMRQIIAAEQDFTQYDEDITGAKKFLSAIKQDLKVELIEKLVKIGHQKVSFYQNGSFVDLCAGPHILNTRMIDPKSFCLHKIAGAYWQADNNREMMQRIYGLAFHTRKELRQYQEFLQEAAKRDHRKIGQAMGLFTFSELVGAGLPLFTPKGTAMRDALVRMLDTIHRGFGYDKVSIPHITKKDLYEVSGHWTKFKDELFHVKGKSHNEFVMKPMNCPHHTQIFAAQPRSYKDLPIRYREETRVYRDEQAGELLGLGRVRAITQDDGHIFCTFDQIGGEIDQIIQIIQAFYTKIGMWQKDNYWVSLSTSDPSAPTKFLGDPKNWAKAEEFLENVLKDHKLPYQVITGEAAFYGPKIDFMFSDALGRERQLATIQLDFVMPERFGLKYIDQAGEKQTPVMIHRAISGSLERFLSIIIEHFAGNFPLWLAPVQVKIIPVNSDAHGAYAKKLLKTLQMQDIRVELDHSDDSLGKKIRVAETTHIPMMLIIGDEELKNNTIMVRLKGIREQKSYQVEELITEILADNKA